MEPVEEVLAGGLGNEGRVVRVGNAVRRPVGPWSPAVHLLLEHLERAGFAGAPRLLGVEDGVEMLEFIPGDVAVPPFPAWSASDELLGSVASLQRQYHDAVADFRPPTDLVWGEGPPPAGFAGPLVCHNDLCLENVVTRDGRAVAFIDFDFARPVDRLWDIAVALRHWVPMWDPSDLDEHRADVDPIARCDRFFETHQLSVAERERTIDALLVFLDGALAFVRARAEAGHTGHVAQWNAGYEGRNRRSARWVAEHRAELVGAGGGDTIRLEGFRPQDQAAVRALILDGLREHWGAIDTGLNPDLDDISAAYGHGTVLVAWSGGRVVGTGTVLAGPSPAVREIVRMSVTADQRGRGVGTRILAELVRIAADSGASQVVLETTAAWTDVVAFYTGYGFRITHERDGEFGPDTHLALDLPD